LNGRRKFDKFPVKKA